MFFLNVHSICLFRWWLLLVGVFTTACAFPAREHLSPEIPEVSTLQRVLTKRFSFFPKKNVLVTALVSPEDGELPPQPWHRILFPGEETIRLVPVMKLTPLFPSYAPSIVCVYAIAGEYPVYPSRLLADLAAQSKGKTLADVFPLCSHSPA